MPQRGEFVRALGCFLLCAVLLLGACAPNAGETLDVFERGFSCEVAGECNGVGFAARYEVAPVCCDGVMPLTVIFYAPEALEGTRLCRGADGAVMLCVGEMTATMGADAFAPLLNAFGDFGGIRRIAVSKEGQTVLECGNATVTFGADGTPLRLQREGLTLDITAWLGAESV